MAIDRQVDNENVLYMYNGLLFYLKNKRNLPFCNKIDDSGECYTKWNKPDMEQIVDGTTYMRNLKPSNSQNQRVEWW